MTIIAVIFGYFRQAQPPKIRFFHATILLLVITQIILSNFMEFTSNGEVDTNPIYFYGSWLHFITGITLIPISIIFIFLCLKEHGFCYFFPYLFNQFEPLKKDINALRNLQFPAPAPKGIASIVQGLGLGALSLALISGFSWFVLWRLHNPWAEDVKELHQALVGLIEAYLIGHGGMGILHIFFAYRGGNNKSDTLR